MITDDPTPTTPAERREYRYRRSSDGCDDVFLIEEPDGNCLFELHYWGEPDRPEAAIAEAKAQLIVTALNIRGGGWVQRPYRFVHLTLAEQREIAAIWSSGDVQELRPDLTDDQAWAVLQHVENDIDRHRGITWDTLRRVAQELFPVAAGSQPQDSPEPPTAESTLPPLSALGVNLLMIEANQLGFRFRHLAKAAAKKPRRRLPQHVGDLADAAETLTGIGTVLRLVADMPGAAMNLEAMEALRDYVDDAASVIGEPWARKLIRTIPELNSF